MRYAGINPNHAIGLRELILQRQINFYRADSSGLGTRIPWRFLFKIVLMRNAGLTRITR
jgi:hypothetical protein